MKIVTSRSLGNVVVPLVEAYKTRYEKLRGAVTCKLLPKREHLLQMRRQLSLASEEAKEARTAIEMETVKDVEVKDK